MKAYVILTDNCNLKCKYCFYELDNVKREHALEIDSLKEFIVHNKNRLSKSIMITGGEPFTHPKIYDLLDWMNKNGFSAEINSNLVNINKDKLSDTADTISMISTSIDHIDPHIHNFIRGHYSDTMDSLEFLIENGIPFRTTTVMSKFNYKQIGNIYSELDNLNPKTMMFQPVDVKGHPLYEEYSLNVLPKSELQKLFYNLGPWAHKYNCINTLESMKRYYLDKAIPEERCAMGKKMFVIDCNGHVYPCFHRHDLYCGNIYHRDGSHILDNINKLEKRIKTKDCFRECCIPLF